MQNVDISSITFERRLRIQNRFDFIVDKQSFTITYLAFYLKIASLISEHQQK